MADVRVVRVFISSPSDVRPERGIAARVVQRLAREFSYHFKVEAVLWEREPMLASHQFQELIVEPHQTDIVVVLLWSRLGMPLPDEARWKGPMSGRRVTGTEWEFEDALAGYRARAVPDLLLYRKRTMALPESDTRQAVDEWLRQKELVDDFMARWFRDAEGRSATAASRSFATGAEFEQMLEANLRELLRNRLTGGAGAEEPPTIRWHRGSPYRGLETFGPEHEPIFFGRTRSRHEIRELLARQAARGCAFVLVMGASGSGKSSLVKAGVLPELLEAGMIGRVALVRYAITRPSARAVSSDALSGFAAALFDRTALPELTSLDHTPAELISLLGKAPEEVVHPIRRGLAAAGRTAKLTDRAQARLLVVVDQLEELFTTEQITASERERYVRMLAALAASSLVWVIATMRSDFFDRLEQLPVLADLASGEAKYLLTPPGGPEIGQIIQQPAHEAGLRFEVDARSGRSLDETIREAAGGSGSLPLLEYLLDQMWNRRTRNGLLTYAAYDALGGLEGAIGRRAEAVLANHPPDIQAALPRLLRSLVTVGQGMRAEATTRHANVEQFKAGSAERHLIAAFLDPQARLLVADGDLIRPAHEALLTHWPRAQGQIAEDRSDLQLRTRLEESMARWRTATGHDKDSLLLASGLPLSEAEDLLKRRHEELDPHLIAYIRYSSAAAQRQADIARQQRDLALLQEARAVSVLARHTIAAGDAQTGILAAMAVLPQNRNDTSRPLSSEAIMALYDGWLHNRESMTLLGHRDVVSSAVFSPDGFRAATASVDGTARLWDISAEHPRTVVLDGHKGIVSGVTFSPDGRRAITASEDGTAQLWDAGAERRRVMVLAGHNGIVRSAAFSPDGRRVVTASEDHTARIWNVTGGQPYVVVLEGHDSDVRSAAFSPDGRRVVTASWDHTARLWDIGSDRQIPVVLEGHTDFVLSAVFSPDGRRVVTTSEDRTARVWDVSGKLSTAVVLEGHKNIVVSAAFSPDGRRLVTASWDGTARLWDVNGERPIAVVLEGHKGRVACAAFSPDGQRVVTAGRDGTVRLWEVSGEPSIAIVLEGHGGPVLSAAFSADGRRLMTSSEDRTARIWDVSGKRPKANVLNDHESFVFHVAFSPDGRQMVTASADRTARVWDMSAEHPTSVVLAGHQSMLVSAAFSPDGRRVVTTSNDDTARLWTLRGSYPTAAVLKGHQARVTSAAFSPDGHRLVTASHDGTARLWDVRGEHPSSVAVLEGHKGRVVRVAFSPDGRRLVTTASDGMVWLWDTSGTRPAGVRLEGHTNIVWHAVFSSDGQRIVTASEDRTARIWDVSSEHTTAVVLRGHKESVISAVFSPDQRWVATASADGTARLWDVSSEHPSAVVLEGHKGGVMTVAFSPSGRRVVTASVDYTARLWDVSGDRPTAVVLEGHGGRVWRAVFSPDGRRVVTVSDDRTVRLWPIFDDEYEFIALVRKSLTRDLTPAQRESLGLSLPPGPFADRNQIFAPSRDHE